MKSDYPDQMRGGGGKAKPAANKPFAKTKMIATKMMKPHKAGGKKGY